MYSFVVNVVIHYFFYCHNFIIYLGKGIFNNSFDISKSLLIK